LTRQAEEDDLTTMHHDSDVSLQTSYMQTMQSSGEHHLDKDTAQDLIQQQTPWDE